MKKGFQVLLLSLLVSQSPAAQEENASLFIEGTALRNDHTAFFTEQFKLEAETFGYALAPARIDAGYILSFDVTANIIVYDDGFIELAQPPDKRFVISVTLIRREGNTPLIAFGFLFTELDEMYEYTQFLFLKAAVFIPRPPPDTETVFVYTSDPDAAGRTYSPDAPPPRFEDSAWQNKWLYLRASFGFPITFYNLVKRDDLVGGIGAYDGDFDKPGRVSPLDNKVMFLPSVTLGIEAQFFDFMSAEVKFQAGWEHLSDRDFINLDAGLQLKAPLKFYPGVTVAPYAAVSFPLPNPIPLPLKASMDIFGANQIFDVIAVGGGVELSVKAGKTGAVFADINYMYSLNKIKINNPLDPLYPNPAQIFYTRSAIGLGIGCKFGFFDRNRAR